MLQSEKFQWLADGVDLPELDYELIQRWLTLVAERHNRIVGNLSDIITFDDCRGRLLRGDMFISLETVATNAVAQGTTYDEELRRVIVHGVLHLCGINDKGPGEREIMEANENEALALLAELS